MPGLGKNIAGHGFFINDCFAKYASFKRSPKDRTMHEATKKVVILELRRLLVELKEHRPDICIRYRLLGQMWAQNFHRVIQVTGNDETSEEGVVLNDETSGRVVLTIRSLAQFMQFLSKLLLDKPFQLFLKKNVSPISITMCRMRALQVNGSAC